MLWSRYMPDPAMAGGGYSNAKHAFHGVGPLTDYLQPLSLPKL